MDGEPGSEMTRVLIIDDEAPIRLLCRVNLEAEQMEGIDAGDGPTGLVARVRLPYGCERDDLAQDAPRWFDIIRMTGIKLE